MFKKSVLFSLLLLFGCVIGTPLCAQEEGPSEEEMQAAWMAYMTPGEAHEMMKKAVGQWKTSTKFYMEPGAPALESEGSCENAMILGGRYLQSKVKGSFMDMPFQGLQTLAYDNAKKVYLSTWIDSFGTGIAHSEGKYNEKLNGVEMWGSMVDPASGEAKKFRTLHKFTDENTQVFDMYMNDGDQEFLSMSMTYTRQ